MYIIRVANAFFFVDSVYFRRPFFFRSSCPKMLTEAHKTYYRNNDAHGHLSCLTPVFIDWRLIFIQHTCKGVDCPIGCQGKTKHILTQVYNICLRAVSPVYVKEHKGLKYTAMGNLQSDRLSTHMKYVLVDCLSSSMTH